MKRKIILITTVILTLVLTLTVTAQPRPKPPRNFGFDKGRIIDLLKLTDDQQNQFFNFFFTHQNEVIDIRADIQKVHLKIKKMMTESDINDEQLLALTEKINQLEGKLKQLKMKFWLNVYKILDENQKKIWTTHFRHFWGRKHHKNFGPPMGRAGRIGFNRF